VYFARGDLARAEKLVAAAWAISQHSEVGDHLGQIFEKQGRRADAIRLYAQAMVADRPAAGVRDRLAHLTGAGSVDQTVAAHREDLSKARTIALDVKGSAGKRADFLVLVASPSRVESVRFVEGDEQMRAMSPALERMHVGPAFPDDQPAKVLRRGILGCSSDGTCSFTLLLPDDARPVK
jgi:hypothetical protein